MSGGLHTVYLSVRAYLFIHTEMRTRCMSVSKPTSYLLCPRRTVRCLCLHLGASLWPRRTHTHTHVRMLIQTYTHKLNGKYTRTHTLPCTHKHKYTHIDLLSSCTHTQAHTRAHTNIHTQTQSYIYTFTHTSMHSQTQTHTHQCTI